mmetsp:Transcript_38356/g.95417  ORF Transcript_38356/g.95417 Transcript_38356/m.95417 type:complete len:248 (-) Transcript_38356:790-1533(-)
MVQSVLPPSSMTAKLLKIQRRWGKIQHVWNGGGDIVIKHIEGRDHEAIERRMHPAQLLRREAKVRLGFVKREYRKNVAFLEVPPGAMWMAISREVVSSIVDFCALPSILRHATSDCGVREALILVTLLLCGCDALQNKVLRGAGIPSNRWKVDKRAAKCAHQLQVVCRGRGRPHVISVPVMSMPVQVYERACELKFLFRPIKVLVWLGGIEGEEVVIMKVPKRVGVYACYHLCHWPLCAASPTVRVL